MIFFWEFLNVGGIEMTLDIIYAKDFPINGLQSASLRK